jgi:urease accessory protein UreF
MLEQTQFDSVEAAELAGDLRPLLELIGSPTGLGALAAAADPLSVSRVDSLPALRGFLKNYHESVLQPLELPAIHRAFVHASRNELRELLAFDASLAGEPLLKNFASASRLVGQSQLLRLRPLRDNRVVQRYIAAVDAGQAHGWHTLVYGLTLAVYSLPPRQGLLNYARLTSRGFIHSAARSIALSADESRVLLDDLCAGLPAAIEATLGAGVSAV